MVSIHEYEPLKGQHIIDTGYGITWRQHAIHWGEPINDGKWRVWGYHYLKDFHDKMPFADTYADSCNIIEGW